MPLDHHNTMDAQEEGIIYGRKRLVLLPKALLYIFSAD